jgi:hypothetical protein
VVTVAVLGASATDDTGPILAFVGAVLVALIAAFTAGRRQKRALEAESGRLAQQLEHERELVDLAAVRSLLDEAASALQSVDLPHPEFMEDADADRERALGKRDELRAIRSRLAVRFGHSHVLVATMEEAIGVLSEWFTAATVAAHSGKGDFGESVRNNAEVKMVESAQEYGESVVAFVSAAANTAGARLP